MSAGSRSKKTLEQLARSLGVELRVVSKAVRQVLGLPAGNARDPQYKLSPYQCSQIKESLGLSTPEPEAQQVDDSGADEAPGEDRPDLRTMPDPISDWSELSFGQLNHGLWFHPDVETALRGKVALRKRLGIVLQHLAAHGRTTVVKGCKDDKNKGWLRSPLGGNNGMQYYLWWSPQGSIPAKGLDLPERDILVRAARHHDDHALLEAGEIDDYLPIRQRELEDEGFVGRPWTADQLRFVENEDPVRLVVGRPGSGKTTVLWKAIEARSSQRVLYLTWSRELTRSAREHFQTFAPDGVNIEARDFTTFLGEICRLDIERRPLAESHAMFEEAIKQLGPNVLGPWSGREKALFAEIRAFLIGRSIPGEQISERSTGIVRLSDAAYLERRASKGGVGNAAATSLLKIFRVIEEHTPFSQMFPELNAAARATEHLQADDVPDGFREFDRVVVDEVQDLTLLEANVIVELCRAIARHRGHSPWLLVAGDDGQTVRPSGFEWGPLSDLIARRVGPPHRFQLESNLRCPSRIASVIDRASRRYVHLEKGRRPTKQRRRKGGQHVEAHLFHVDAESRGDAIELLENLEDVEGVVVVSPQEDLPDWLPFELQDMVLTPADTKGLEYQSVCLLEPGRLLARLEPSATDMTAADLEEYSRRTAIDQLRVALSRATETLAFIDVGVGSAERALSLELLGDAAPFDPEDLVEHFADADVPVEERVLARTNDARALIDERPRRAWRRAYQAVRLLGDPNLPNGVSDNSVRREAQITLLATGARLLVDGAPEGVTRRDVIEATKEVLERLDSVRDQRAFLLLDIWSSNRSNPPFDLFESALTLDSDGDWLRAALVPVSQQLRQAMEGSTTSPSTATAFSGEVDGWLQLTNFAGNVAAEARRLRCVAAETLLEARDLSSAELVLKQVEPEDPMRTGRLREAQGRHEDAAEAFERAGSSEDALRNWRSAGRWERAVLVAPDESEERSDLEWLVEVEGVMNRRPDGHAGRLTAGERVRVEGLMDSSPTGRQHAKRHGVSNKSNKSNKR